METERDQWRQRIETELKSQSGILVDMHKELIGGEFNDGLFKEVKHHKVRLDNHDATLDEYKKTHDFVQNIRKVSGKTIWAGIVGAWGWLLAFLYYVACKIWPALKLIGMLAEKHNHNA